MIVIVHSLPTFLPHRPFDGASLPLEGVGDVHSSVRVRLEEDDHDTALGDRGDQAHILTLDFRTSKLFSE